MDYELLLFDRLNAIRDTIRLYGEDKFYLSFSGGKDSTILHYMIDMALPDNKIPRVYANTGIDLNMVNQFVKELAEHDSRILMIKPTTPIKQMLDTYGYPFKSKHHSYMLEKFQRLGMIKGVKNYLGVGDNEIKKTCPKKLRYQFTESFNIKISDACCLKMKEEPLTNWAIEHNRSIAITGIMPSESGRRIGAQCIVKHGGHVKFFNPMVKVDKDFENWFINKYQIKLCNIYYPPYNFHRTGCKGCPFAVDIQRELDIMEEKFPSEFKQCNIIWKPIYDEYKRIGYRLRRN